MRELKITELHEVSGGVAPAGVAAAAGSIGVAGFAAVGAFGVGYAIGTAIYRLCLK